MRITKFEAENFKRLKAIDITPDANTVVIAGRNAQGKTSVLDGIMAALAGRNGAKELVRPIRDGESKARVLVELDDLVVERKWTPSGSTVVVSPKGGNARLNSPQAVLDKLIGSLSFDPLGFAEAEPKKQVEILIDLIGRKSFDELTYLRKEAYERRTEVNREVKRIQAQIDGIGPVEDVEPVDVAALVEEDRVARRRRELGRQWKGLGEQIAELVARQQAIADEGAALPESRDVETLKGLLDNAQDINRKADAAQRVEALLSEGLDAEQMAKQLTGRIEALDAAKADLISNAALPVEGLTFDDEGVEYNGVPFIQSSAAERLKVSVGMAMALNPELRVICIRDASLLDKDSKNVLIALAKQHDYQIWYEVVGDGGKVGVVIEDGQVQA